MHFQPKSPETCILLLVLSSIELRSSSHAWSWTKVDSLDSPQRSTCRRRGCTSCRARFSSSRARDAKARKGCMSTTLPDRRVPTILTRGSSARVRQTLRSAHQAFLASKETKPT